MPVAPKGVLTYNDNMTIAHLNLDTHRVVKHLESKGYTEEQAEGFIEAIEEISLIGVATKEDFNVLNTKIDALGRDLEKKIADSRHELKQEIAEVQHNMMRFMLLQTGVIIGVTFGLVKFL